ncbi:MAG: MBOAT family O-acyltransferase [Bacteroidota bacterium]
MNDFLTSLLYHAQSPLIFNSVLFILLFTLFYVGYVFVYNDVRKRNTLLLIFSLYFYYKISGLYVILLVLMGTSDFFIGKAMFSSTVDSKRKLLLFLSLFINIGSLIFFKYTNFFLNSLFGAAGQGESPILLNLIMPLGISFYVFKTLSYILDIYRERAEEYEKSWLNYLLFVSFFPNILAGPISKSRDLLPQFRQKNELTNELIGAGLFLILVGAFKKIFIADFLGANLVDRVFDSPEYFTGFEGLMATYGYTAQIYFDFSGYTDIVIGLACLMGFRVEPNFNKPFLATNVVDFWRRWHMTLSGWLNEYVFYPLSYNLRSYKKRGIVIGVLITFFISGLWHGPAWTYILWGISHGIAIAWTMTTGDAFAKLGKTIPKWLYRFLSIIITFHFLTFSMILFRAPDLNGAWKMYTLIFTKFDISVAAQWAQLYMKPLIILILAYVLHYLPMKWINFFKGVYVKMHWTVKALIVVLAILFIYQAYSSDAQPFIYLEF